MMYKSVYHNYVFTYACLFLPGVDVTLHEIPLGAYKQSVLQT
jgi:hypothetical protein